MGERLNDMKVENDLLNKIGKATQKYKSYRKRLIHLIKFLKPLLKAVIKHKMKRHITKK